MDRLTEIEVFTQVVEHESFTAASDKLGMSRAMVSKYVMALEQRLGARLLNRTTRRLSLTEAGRNFFEQSTAILAALAEAEAQVGESTVEPRGALRINAPMSFGILHLAAAIRIYLDAHPEVSIDLDLNDRVVDLVDEGYDLAIRIGQLADSSLIARKIATDRMVICAAPDYIARHGKPERPADLKNHFCLLYSYQQIRDGWRFVTEGGTETVKIASRFRTNNGNVIANAAASGLGIAHLPTFIGGADIKAGRLVPLLEEFTIPELGIFAVYPEGRFVTRKVRSFIDFLVGHFGPRPYWQVG